MKSDWLIVAEVCQAKGVDMEVIVRPDKYRDEASVAKRTAVLRQARQEGVTVSSLTTLCPMSERRIREMVGNKQQMVLAGLESSAEIPPPIMLGNNGH